MEEHEAEVYFAGALPKTRSGKMLRRNIQDVAEQCEELLGRTLRKRPPKPGGILDENPTDDRRRPAGHEVLPREHLAHKTAYLAPRDLLLCSGI